MSFRAMERLDKNRGKAVVFIGISKKVVPLATGRNRLKRLIREVLRKSVVLKDGMEYRIRVDKVPPGIDYQLVENTLVAFFK